MIITGIGWEFVKRLYNEGFASIPDFNAPYENHWQYGVMVNAIAAEKLMDDMLIESGTNLYYSQPIVATETDGNRINSAIIATKSGLKRIFGRTFIDATGDGDFSAFAGASFEAGDGNGVFQPGTIRYYPETSVKGDYLQSFGINKNHITGIDVTDSDAMTKAEIRARRLLYKQMKESQLSESVEKIITAAPALAPREGRRIRGLSEMNVKDYKSGKLFEDSICYSFWFVDIHKDGGPSHIENIKSEKTPTVRLSSLLSKDFSNLFMSGRCICTDRATNSAIRVKSTCMVTGQVAGTAAAVSVISLPFGGLIFDFIYNIARTLFVQYGFCHDIERV